jgi:hypothetical protein
MLEEIKLLNKIAELQLKVEELTDKNRMLSQALSISTYLDNSRPATGPTKQPTSKDSHAH